ncbi:MAG: fructokinase [Edaphobacter sp.]|uniref:fructokinase n=1 Tax=Edaphobacter sp. TaxID=1934404 RepID=UPI00238FA92D|nr:fructokinase [Edaphobacter sp.]MDE1177554.1 fructokinase [Edaphobacter sp.]
MQEKNVGSRPEMRIGIDVGGTKIEALAIDNDGKELLRYRVDTPRDDYQGTIDAIVGLVHRLESETGLTATVGAGIPGSISAKTGLVKNANSTWLNGMPFDKDLSKAMNREVRLANDANCLAVSEATDGAAAGKNVVFGVILGTGCGGGVALGGHVHAGPNGDGGEWGHIPLPWPREDENPGPLCYCGKPGCMEMWVSGTGLARDYKAVTGTPLTSREIIANFLTGDADATAAVDRLVDRLARGMANIVNILDPDAFVIGGGLSHTQYIYQALPERLKEYVFGGEFDTPILQAKYGDSSGVRGAAWLWPLER